MKQSFYKSLALSALMTFSLTSAAETPGDYEVRAFYGDKELNRVVVIDLANWTELDAVDTVGETPYPVDQAGYLDKVYAITRGSSSMDIIDAETLENLGLLHLNHKPRSGESYNSKLGLALIAGADKPLTSVIDVSSDTVVAEAGKDIFTTQTRDNGGTISSGHPAWLTKDRFVVIDRANRKIQLWGIEKRQHRFGYRHGYTNGMGYEWKTTLLDEVKTPTSVHHILHRNTAMLPENEKLTFYALAEGKSSTNKGGAINPAILRLTLSSDTNSLSYDKDTDTISLPGEPEEMKSHHADFHPDGMHIYVGSTEGNLYVIDKDTGTFLNEGVPIKTGKGTGHTRFIPAKNLALVTNHNDIFVTAIDTLTHTKIKDIYFPFSNALKADNEILQSHTNYVSPDNNFYYAFARAYGIFFEITLDLKPDPANTENPENLDNLKISNTLKTGGVPVQGSFLNSDYFSYSATHSSSGM